MAIVISGPGIGLPRPQNLYPSQLANAPGDWGNNFMNLSPGDSLVVPAGNWFLDYGQVCVQQYLDPVTGAWRISPSARDQYEIINSDGFTRRIANLTGCPVAAVVAGGGTSFAAATCSITASTGGSTWQAVVGGSLSVSSVTVKGANFTVNPLVLIPAPPSPGVQATAYATLSSGTVSAVSLTNFGAGYTQATITCPILPNPFDPSIATVTNAACTMVLANSGVITAAICTNNGASLATLSALTLTASGGSGSGATITPVVMQTATSITVTSGGVGWGNAASPALVMSINGVPASTSAIVNPALELTSYIPRPFQGSGTTNAGGTISAVVIRDPGLFVGTPTAVIAPGGTVPTTAATLAMVMGGQNDVVMMQPL